MEGCEGLDDLNEAMSCVTPARRERRTDLQKAACSDRRWGAYCWEVHPTGTTGYHHPQHFHLLYLETQRAATAAATDLD